MASVLKSICRKKAKADKFLITASVSLLFIDCRRKNGKGKKSTFFVFVYVQVLRELIKDLDVFIFIKIFI